MIKQFLTVAVVMVAVFLPVRFVFYNFVTTYWLGNLGVMSIIAIIMFVLIEKNKLGWFGRYYKNRVRHLVFHKIVWLVVATGIFTIIFYGTALFLIDMIESGKYQDDLDLLTSIVVYTPNVTKAQLESIKDIGLYPSNDGLIKYGTGLADNSTQNRLTELFSDDNATHTLFLMMGLLVHEYNQKSGAWGAHFITVIIVEELEALILLAFYRKMYFIKGGESWHKLGLYPKNIKKLVKWYNKKEKKSEVY